MWNHTYHHLICDVIFVWWGLSLGLGKWLGSLSSSSCRCESELYYNNYYCLLCYSQHPSYCVCAKCKPKATLFTCGLHGNLQYIIIYLWVTIKLCNQRPTAHRQSDLWASARLDRTNTFIENAFCVYTEMCVCIVWSSHFHSNLFRLTRRCAFGSSTGGIGEVDMRNAKDFVDNDHLLA